MEYMSPAYKDTGVVDALILQAPVADRGALRMDLGHEALDESVKIAKEFIDKGKGDDRIPKEYVPQWFGPISAQRWYSLAAFE
jgi:hypothetical protein